MPAASPAWLEPRTPATDIAVLDGGFAAWAADPSLPVDKLPRHEQLVHVDWLSEVLAGGRPEAAPAGKFLLFHVNFGVPEEYEENHLPGALYLDTNWLEDSSRLESPLAGGARARPAQPGHHQRHDGHPVRPRHRGRRPTRSGPAVGPARSPRPGR